MALAWRVATAVMLLAFGLSVVVQFNDPDPIPWVAIYGAAAVVCALEIARRGRWWAAALVGAIALVWAATIAPRVVGTIPFTSMFGEFEMQNLGVEESREMYGLLIVALWMSAVVLARRRRGPR